MVYAPAGGSAEISDGTSAQAQLRGVLAELRVLARSMEGCMDTFLDVLQPVDFDTFGAGLVFRIVLKDVDAEKHTDTGRGHRRAEEKHIVCAGGRCDRLLRYFACLHCGEGQDGSPSGARSLDLNSFADAKGNDFTLCGVCVEFAIDKLAGSSAKRIATPAHVSLPAGRRGKIGGSAVPWWRQLPSQMNIKFHVLLCMVAPACMEHSDELHRIRNPPASPSSKLGENIIAEALLVARSFWKLGLRCDLQVVSKTPKWSDIAAANNTAIVPDFLLSLWHNGGNDEGDCSYRVRTISDLGMDLLQGRSTREVGKHNHREETVELGKPNKDGTVEWKDRQSCITFFEQLASFKKRL